MLCDPDHPKDEFKPLTAEEAQALRARMPQFSVWKIVAMQAGMSMAAALLAWALTGLAQVALSVAYGGLSVVVPSALFARGMTSRLTRVNLGTAVAGFLLWELVKIGLTVAMLFMANWWIKDVNWPALLVGFVVTMKVHWVVLAIGRRSSSEIKS